MAVTNHAKNQFLPPAWARRGKLRLAHAPGGPSAAAARVLSGEWGAAGHNPGELLLAARYGPGLLDELLAKQINTVVLTWSPGLSHKADLAQWDCVRALLPLLRKKKIRTIARIAVDTCFHEELAGHEPAAHGWALGDDAGGRRDAARTAGETPAVQTEGARAWQMDIGNADWRAYVAYKVRMAVAAGFDGVFFDGTLGDFGDAATQAESGRRDAARTAGETPAVQTEGETPAVQTEGETPAVQTEGETPAVQTEGETPAVQALRFLRDEALAGRSTDSRELLFCARGWCAPHWDELCNLKLVDYGWWHCPQTVPSPRCGERTPLSADSGTPQVAADGSLETCLPFLKLMYEQGGRDKPLAVQLGASGLTEAQLRLAVAEVLASGGVPASLDLPRNYVSFLRDHGDLFGQSDPVGSIGVIVDDTAPKPRVEALLLPGELVHTNVQFDLIPLTQWERFDLRKYKLLITAGLPPPPPLHEALNHFVSEHGGTVYVAQSCGDFASELHAHILPGIRIAAGTAPVEVEAPDGVVALLWGKGTRRWVHLLNYRAELAQATVVLPGCGGRAVSAHSPDEAQPELTVLETGQASVSFALSGIQTYAIVEVA